MSNKIDSMKALIELLNQAGKVYYQEDRELMSNFEYDKLYDKLKEMEDETGVVLAGSPTASVGYESLEELPKERHERTMLSLDKTKDVEALKSFVGNQKALISWKLDGLTVVLTYRNGNLEKAVTRGNGEIGEVVTNNAKVFQNIPYSIQYKGELILRGEAVISYHDFAEINEEIEEVAAKYKNPRNLCSGSVRQLNNEITARRRVKFYAFSLVKADGIDFENSRGNQFEWLSAQGFDVVEYQAVESDEVETAVTGFAKRVAEYNIPSDGLVVIYDNIAYGQSLGSTAKFPRDSLAFKWVDEIKETQLLDIEWSPSRTGLINPVAIFEPVELEGSTVSRASVHNLSIMKALQLGIGDMIQVYKANMIIPQIAENLTRSDQIKIPKHCPVCKGNTKISAANDVETLYCTNDECQAKQIKSFTLFVSRDALNIEGLSEATLEKFIARGFIMEYADIFRISRFRDEIIEMEGFGEKSYENLTASLERARKTTLPRLIYGLGIRGIGVANARMICKAFEYDLNRLRHCSPEELSAVDGIGDVLGNIFAEYFKKEKNNEMLDHLLKELEIETPAINGVKQQLEGKNFVITGSVKHFSNRNEIKAMIEEKGGKVTGSVTSKTDFLINNEISSNSSKNKKAKELGIPILSEEDFIKMLE